MLPRDPYLLYSIINTKLRDLYKNINDLCYDEDISLEEIENILHKINCFYNKELNRFIILEENKNNEN